MKFKIDENLPYPPVDFPGLIVLRLSHQDKQHILQVIKRVIRLFPSEAVEQRLWIVEERKISIRT
jgi:hypothetical protein